MLLDDDTALIGTPGPYTWRGTVFAVSVSDDFLRRDKTAYYIPLTHDRSPVDKYSYLGTSCLFFGSPNTGLPSRWCLSHGRAFFSLSSRFLAPALNERKIMADPRVNYDRDERESSVLYASFILIC